MSRPNPFLRRASSPGEVNNESNLLSVPALPSHPAKLTQASFSDSALKVPVRPSTFRNTQPHMMSIRPSRFIKASTPSNSSSPITDIQNNNSQFSNDMLSFIKLFDTFNQKLYIEGYLMKHNTTELETEKKKKARTKMFVEVSGSTLTLWDTEIPGSTVMPTYFQITDTTTVSAVPHDGPNKKKKFVFQVQNKKASITFETSDEPSMIRWICAIRLSYFEKQKLHQLFTLKLLASDTIITNLSSTSLSSSSSNSVNLVEEKGSFLQVRLPGASIWQKYWVVLANHKQKKKTTAGGSSTEDRPKRFGNKKQPNETAEEQQILLYEGKKSKQPLWALSRLTQAYAVYPESPQLIEKGSTIRIDCNISRRGTNKPSLESIEETGHCWFMADHSQLTIQWLLAVYDTFSLYGRPDSLLQDAHHPQALNYGEPAQDVHQVVYPKLFLELDEVSSVMDPYFLTRSQIDTIMLEVIARKQAETRTTITRRPTGTRTNSLPLITVLVTDEPRKVNIMNSLDLEDPSSFKFSRQVADSSDESDGEEDEGEEDDEDDEEVDSDDEPIGRKSMTSPEDIPETMIDTPPKTFVGSLIPDFDFGNGFDVPKNVTAAAVAAAISATNMSQTLPTRGKQKRGQAGSGTRGNSIMMFQQAEDDLNLSLHVRKSSMPAASNSKELQPVSDTTQAPAAASSLFGDFSLSMDFKKFLDEPLLEQPKKASLPPATKLASMESSRSTSSTSRWDHEVEEQEEPVEEEPIPQPDQPFEDDNHSYDSDFDGPMIPSLGDHFATQNSLLDTYLGEQLSAKEQIEFAKATGQPLIQVSSKKQGAPKGGLVGMISQREKNRKEGNGLRVAERVNQYNAQDRFEREKERRIFEQRQQQFMKHQMMLYASGYSMHPMPMMPSFVGPMSPIGPMSPMGTMPPMNPMPTMGTMPPMSPMPTMGPMPPMSPMPPNSPIPPISPAGPAVFQPPTPQPQQNNLNHPNSLQPPYNPNPIPSPILSLPHHFHNGPISPHMMYGMRPVLGYQQARPSLSAPLITLGNRKMSNPGLEDSYEITNKTHI